VEGSPAVGSGSAFGWASTGWTSAAMGYRASRGAVSLGFTGEGPGPVTNVGLVVEAGQYGRRCPEPRSGDARAYVFPNGRKDASSARPARKKRRR
jgi:hypothetical protein